MPTITQTITDKLLDGGSEPGELEVVLQEYAHNKGPLYLALAQATSIMTEKLATTTQQYKERNAKLNEQQQKIQEAEQHLQTLDGKVDSQSAKLVSLEHKVQENSTLLNQVNSLRILGFGLAELEKIHHTVVENVPVGGKSQDAVALFFKFVEAYPHLVEIDSVIQKKKRDLISLDSKVQAKQGLLDQMKTVIELGMGIKELVKLHEMLVKFGALQGMPSTEITKQFFTYVSKFQDAVALDTHIQQLQNAVDTAKAEVAHWQAEEKAAEAKTKARKVSINITEKFLAHGIKEPDLPHWNNLLERCGVSADALGQELVLFTSIEKLRQNRQNQVDRLETAIKSLTAQVNALTDDREQVSAAITSVRDKALVEVEVISKKTMDNINSLMLETENYKKLQQEAAELGSVIRLAQLIKGWDGSQWSQVDAATIRVLVTDVQAWCKANPSHDPDLVTPTGKLASKAAFYSFYKISLSEVLDWILKSL